MCRMIRNGSGNSPPQSPAGAAVRAGSGAGGPVGLGGLVRPCGGIALHSTRISAADRQANTGHRPSALMVRPATNLVFLFYTNINLIFQAARASHSLPLMTHTFGEPGQFRVSGTARCR